MDTLQVRECRSRRSPMFPVDEILVRIPQDLHRICGSIHVLLGEDDIFLLTLPTTLPVLVTERVVPCLLVQAFAFILKVYDASVKTFDRGRTILDRIELGQ